MLRLSAAALAMVALPLLVGARQDAGQQYLGVKEWWGSIDVEIDGERTSGNGFTRIRRTASLSFHLNGHSGNQAMGAWHFKPEGKGAAALQEYPDLAVTFEECGSGRAEEDVEGGFHDVTTSIRNGRGAGAIRSSIMEVPGLQIDVRKRTYNLITTFDSLLRRMNSSDGRRLEQPLTWHSVKTYGAGNQPTKQWSSNVKIPQAAFDPEWPKVEFAEQPLPEEFGPLQGIITLKAPLRKSSDATTIVVRWSLSPSPPVDLELIVEPANEGAYRNWRPTAGESESVPGEERLAVRARLQKKGGGAPETKASRIRLELSDVTRIPGTCINLPRADPQSLPEADLKFEAPAGGDIVLAGDHRAERRGKKLTEATVNVASFDWGGFGVVKARAVLEDGRVIDGHIAGDDKRKELRIPKSANDSMIADSWKERVGATGKDDSDEDDEPKGDGHKGDGLTLYEEYRGWYEFGARVSGTFDGGDPKTKNYFVNGVDGVYIADGLELFHQVTGLAVSQVEHGELSRDEVINFNSLGAPHAVDQHGIRVMQVPALRKTAGAAIGSVRPGPPGEKRLVIIRDEPAPLPLFKEAEGYAPAFVPTRTIAHELCHCCNVYHHGDTDQDRAGVMWAIGKDAAGAEAIIEMTSKGALPIRIRQEEPGRLGPDVTASILAGIKSGMRGSQGGASVALVGTEGGQCSGDERCVMTYQHADFFMVKSDPSLRVLVRLDEKQRVFDLSEYHLCSGKSAFEWNASDHKPGSHFGPATLGNCSAQILVNDAVKDVPRR
jgi:hypothetical protein